MEIAVRGSIGPLLAVPTPYLILGGFRLVELAALAFCEHEKVVIYVEKAVDLPYVLEGCRFEVRKVDMLPPDVYTVEAGCVPQLLKSRECTKPISTIADMIEINIEVMRWALDRIRQLGIELTKGDVRGHVYGDIYNRGKIYEYTYVEGPAVIGPTSEVLPFTYLRQGSVLYHNSKVRDEVKNSIFDAYSRKQHGGYVGDSYVASFVNMGAGTNVSNLKNTLGLIKTSYGDKRYRKLGPVFGEFVKTAIGTSIYGGKYIGPLSHLYGVVDRDVPPISIYRHGEITPIDREKARELVARDLTQFGRTDLLHFYLTALGLLPRE